MTWVLILLTMWLLAAVAVAVLIGRGVRLADAEAAPASADHEFRRHTTPGATAVQVEPYPPGGDPVPGRRPAGTQVAHRAVPVSRRAAVRGWTGTSERPAMHRGRGAA